MTKKYRAKVTFPEELASVIEVMTGQAAVEIVTGDPRSGTLTFEVDDDDDLYDLGRRVFDLERELNLLRSGFGEFKIDKPVELDADRVSGPAQSFQESQYPLGYKDGYNAHAARQARKWDDVDRDLAINDIQSRNLAPGLDETLLRKLTATILASYDKTR